MSLKPKIKSVVKARPKKRERKIGNGASLVITLGYLYGECEAYSNL